MTADEQLRTQTRAAVRRSGTSQATPVTAVLPDRFTANLTPDQTDDATRMFSHIAATYTPDLALTWLTGMDPFLGDACPLTAIRDGHTADVWRAAHNLTHTTATTPAARSGA